jgi:hypothetical protein
MNNNNVPLLEDNDTITVSSVDSTQTVNTVNTSETLDTNLTLPTTSTSTKTNNSSSGSAGVSSSVILSTETLYNKMMRIDTDTNPVFVAKQTIKTKKLLKHRQI